MENRAVHTVRNMSAGDGIKGRREAGRGKPGEGRSRWNGMLRKMPDRTPKNTGIPLVYPGGGMVKYKQLTACK